MTEERDPISHDQIQEWGYYIENETTLSPQEAQVFVRIFQMHKLDICEDLDIDKPHLDTVLNRIQDKIGKATATSKIGHVLSSRERWRTQSIPFGSALIGCANPECDEDVETAEVNQNFKNHYTKTVNLYDNEQELGNVRHLEFCSFECVERFEELVRK